jgi:hypothetical protein
MERGSVRNNEKRGTHAALSLLVNGVFWCLMITFVGWGIAIAKGEMSWKWACGSFLAGLGAAITVPAIGNAIAKDPLGARYGAIAGAFLGLAIGDLALGLPLTGGADIAGDAANAQFRLIGPAIGLVAGATAGACTQRLVRRKRHSRSEN